MAAAISKHLNDQEHLVVPTVIVMTAATSFLLGVAFYTMGRLHITSFANYIPFPGTKKLQYTVYYFIA